MEIAPMAATIVRVRDPDRIKRYTLVPRTPLNGSQNGVTRFSLARVGVTPRSALGVDRHERLERIVEADQERHRESAGGSDPAERREDAHDNRS
jgi:hypothetical protein